MYVVAPAEYTLDAPCIFLAGGISDAENWQPWMVQALEGTGIVTLNPRRKNFPMHDCRAAEEQISWEFRHLRKATAKLFWFPPQTLCPITLFELGAASVTHVPLFVGVHPLYKRRQDVILQLRLARPEVNVVFDLESVAAQVIEWAAKGVSCER